MSDPEHPPARRRRLPRFLIAGLATLLPVVLTGYILFALYRFVHTNLGQWIAMVLARVLRPVWSEVTWRHAAIWAAGDVLAVVIVLGLSMFVGALAATFIGRRIIRLGERFILRVPFVKVIYPYVKQVTDFLFSEKKVAFRNVVAVPYPRQGVYSLGFVTGQGWRSMNAATGHAMVQVFIPSSPTPVTGYVVFVPRDDIVELPITVDQAFRFCISGGVIVPPQEVLEKALQAQEEKKRLVEPTPPAWAEEE